MAPIATPLEPPTGPPPSPSTEEASEESASPSLNLRKNLTSTFDSFADKKRSHDKMTTPLFSVFLRIRPTTTTSSTLEILPCQTKVRTIPPEPDTKRHGIKEYAFQEVFGSDVTQNEVYAKVAQPLVRDFIEHDKSGLLFTYGMTNAGKTHTILGCKKYEGLLPKAIREILESGNNELKMSYLEIYNENIFDLLGKNKEEKLKLREDRDGRIFVKGLSQHSITDIQQALDLATIAKQKRHTSSNNLNVLSSRSHCIIQLEINSTPLYLVDLAGSERSKRTNTLSFRLKEANIINSSLMKLNKCLVQMQSQQLPISFRESKLTHFFMNHFQTAQSTVMVVCVNPNDGDYDETQGVLGYASVARSVRVPLGEYCKKRRINLSSQGSKRKTDDASLGASTITTVTTQEENNASRISKFAKKLSPRAALAKKREITKKRRMELQKLRAGKNNDTNNHSTVSLPVGNRLTRSTTRSALLEEIQKLKVHVKTLNNENSELKKQAEETEAEIRLECAMEMQAHIQNVKEYYKNLIPKTKTVPTPSKTIQKLKRDQREKYIEQWMEAVSECEEEMVRMRDKHKEEMVELEERMELEHEKLIVENDALKVENERLKEDIRQHMDEECVEQDEEEEEVSEEEDDEEEDEEEESEDETVRDNDEEEEMEKEDKEEDHPQSWTAEKENQDLAQNVRRLPRNRCSEVACTLADIGGSASKHLLKSSEKKRRVLSSVENNKLGMEKGGGK